MTLERNKNPENSKSKEHLREDVKLDVRAKLGALWSEIKTTASAATKEFMTRTEILRPFLVHADEVRKITALKTYKRGSGDWREINKKLEKVGVQQKDIIALQKYLKLTPDGKMGPRTIAGFTTLIGKEANVRLTSKTTIDEQAIKQIEQDKQAQMTPIKAKPLPPPTTLENPRDLTDAPIDEEKDDTSYTEENDKDADTVPVQNEGLLLNKEQAIFEAYKVLTRGHLRSAQYSRAKREAWAKDIIAQMEATKISLTRQHILMIAVTIDRESGFKEIPVVNNPERILDRKIAEEKTQHPRLYALLEDRANKYRKMALDFIGERRKENLKKGLYRTTSTGEKIGVFTERDMDLAIDWVKSLYDEEMPLAGKAIISKDALEKYRPNTIGSMQVNVQKAIDLGVKYEGKRYTNAEMRDFLNTREGGLKYGLYYMKEILDSHEKQGTLDEQNVKFAFLDYNMGVFSARNAGIQEALNKMGAKLVVDGDLLLYDQNGKPRDNESKTEDAIQDILDDNDIEMSDKEIRADLLKEKSKEFENTRTYRELVQVFKKKNIVVEKAIPRIKAKGSFVKTGSKNLNATGYVTGSYRRYRRLGSA